MKLAIVDFGSYAFTAQLARTLAGRGHKVLYSGFADFQGPKAAVREDTGGQTSLSFEPVSLGEEFHRYNFARRRGQEIRLGRAFAEQVRRHGADVVISANTPIDVAATLQKAAAREGIAYVHWLQDIISLAMKTVLTAKLGAAGQAVTAYYAWREARLLRASDAVIAITDDFFRALSGVSLDPARCHTVPNWAPLDELPVLPKDNDWARAHGIAGKRVLLYSGSMGLKHNPRLIVAAAEALAGDPGVAIVVVAEGVGADFLAEAKRQKKLDNLTLLPYQRIELLPQVLAASDVLTAFVDAEASDFCVPSKVLTYLCAGRAVLLAIPRNNLAARIVGEHGLGATVAPDDCVGYRAAVIKLLEDQGRRQISAANARAYAERNFEIGAIADRFEAILAKAIAGK